MILLPNTAKTLNIIFIFILVFRKKNSQMLLKWTDQINPNISIKPPPTSLANLLRSLYDTSLIIIQRGVRKVLSPNAYPKFNKVTGIITII